MITLYRRSTVYIGYSVYSVYLGYNGYIRYIRYIIYIRYSGYIRYNVYIRYIRYIFLSISFYINIFVFCLRNFRDSNIDSNIELIIKCILTLKINFTFALINSYNYYLCIITYQSPYLTPL